jgi:hypothetical protein
MTALTNKNNITALEARVNYSCFQNINILGYCAPPPVGYCVETKPNQNE